MKRSNPFETSKHFFTPCLLGFLSTLVATPVFGAMNGYNLLAGSAGVAAPSADTALDENPVGLLYSRGMGASISGHSPTTDFKDPTFGAEINMGRHDWGLGLGGDYRSSATGSVSTARYGLALNLSAFRIGVGFSGATQMNPSGGSTYNVGAIFNPFDAFRLAILALDASNGPAEMAGGFALVTSSSVVFSTDISSPKGSGNIYAQPGLMIGGSGASLTASYGFTISGTGEVVSRLLSEGISAGAAFRVGSKTSLSGYYKHLDKVFAQLSFDL